MVGVSPWAKVIQTGLSAPVQVHPANLKQKRRVELAH